MSPGMRRPVALAIWLSGTLLSAPALAAHCPPGQIYRIRLDRCVGAYTALARPYVGFARRSARRIAFDPPAARAEAAAPAPPPADKAQLAAAAAIAVAPALQKAAAAASAAPQAGVGLSPAPSHPAEPDAALWPPLGVFEPAPGLAALKP
jgi:hypothetical protein